MRKKITYVKFIAFFLLAFGGVVSAQQAENSHAKTSAKPVTVPVERKMDSDGNYIIESDTKGKAVTATESKKESVKQPAKTPATKNQATTK